MRSRYRYGTSPEATMARFVDANVFPRFLLNDHATWSQDCERLFLAVERGDEQVWTSEALIESRGHTSFTVTIEASTGCRP